MLKLPYIFLEGRKHYAGMLADSGLLNALEQHAFSPAGQPMCVYRDLTYPLRVYLHAPFRNAVMAPHMREYNARMSTTRVSVGVVIWRHNKLF